VLKLRRIELLGFKSFSDRGEIAVQDTGVTAIVGPNGCGKSNVSDAIAWVLGEQSAKSLRGEKMEDVIFNGTRNRPPMGMAEVTITLTETNPLPPVESLPESSQANGQTNGYANGHPNGHANGHGNGHTNGHANGAATYVNGTDSPPAGPRDIVVQRRLYRDGESAYLIDGKACRLRDIHEIFLGTGLGPNSYAIIEQGRIGQLLSSKPMDRRALVEEAAGITKFKAKRKLAESRLEAARQNLSRVNDILAEVDRQRNSLKRQAGKARRYIELRNRMREILSAVFATRADMLVHKQEEVEFDLAAIGDAGRRLEAEIERLNALVHQRRDDVTDAEKTLSEGHARHSEVELEREKATQRVERLEDQIRALEERKATLGEEHTRIVEELDRNQGELAARAAQLEETETDRLGVIESIERMKTVLTGLNEERAGEERAIGELRRQQFEVIGNEARIGNEITSRREMIQRILAQIDRLEREAAVVLEFASRINEEVASARNEHLDYKAGMMRLQTQLAAAEEECAHGREKYSESVQAAADCRSKRDGIQNRLQTIGDLAVRRAYSTESVQQFFNYVRGRDWEPLGMLADFIEVDTRYESIVEDFLRPELQYVVVKDRAQAAAALSIVKDVTRGRLECLVLNGETPLQAPEQIADAIPLFDVVKFDERVKHVANYFRNAYVVETVEKAWELADKYPHCRFVATSGEVIHGHVVSWGQREALGPLSLKREIRQLDRDLDAAVRETALREEESKTIEDKLKDAEAQRGRLVSEVQEIEKTILMTDHRVRTLSGDLAHAQQRLEVARTEISRFTQERNELEAAIQESEAQRAGIAATKEAILREIALRSINSEALVTEIESKRRELGEIQARLAVLEERRSSIEREIATLEQQVRELQERGDRAEQQIQQAEEQQMQSRAAIESLDLARQELLAEHDRLNQRIAEISATLEELRNELHGAEQKWDESRAELDAWKDRHTALEIERTKVDSDLKHLASSCWSELNETIEAVCLKSFEVLPLEQLELQEKEYEDIREKMESMGAVNMMAVEEYQEAEQRFEFLSGQRQDLLDSIRDTAQAITEIDTVCRKQFKEAFEAIDAGFRTAFVHLFGGGHGELRLMEDPGQEETDAGVEIVAQPPGKKLQNVLLLSGGEKALTALALLIAMFRFKPSPFCVLDEVDAPLDDANVDRFANMVREMSSQTQFIVITHSKRTMETASTLYGVTMEEPGISKIVSVRLN
jgi:chromosome segregation protein